MFVSNPPFCSNETRRVISKCRPHCARSSAHRAVALELQNFEVAASKAAIVYETNLRERAEYEASLGETGASSG